LRSTKAQSLIAASRGIDISEEEIQQVKQTCRNIPGLPTNYWVSPCGLLYDLQTKRTTVYGLRQPHRLFGSLQGNYLVYGIPDSKRTHNDSAFEGEDHDWGKQWDAATLVALAWIGPKPNDAYMVCHADGIPSNDSASNLYWGTAKDNAADAKWHKKHGTGNSESIRPDICEQLYKQSQKLPEDLRIAVVDSFAPDPSQRKLGGKRKRKLSRFEQECADADIPVISLQEYRLKQRAEKIWEWHQSRNLPDTGHDMTPAESAQLMAEYDAQFGPLEAEPEEKPITNDYEYGGSFGRALMETGVITTFRLDDESHTEPF
jgi:hypothetical protein